MQIRFSMIFMRLVVFFSFQRQLTIASIGPAEQTHFMLLVLRAEGPPRPAQDIALLQHQAKAPLQPYTSDLRATPAACSRLCSPGLRSSAWHPQPLKRLRALATLTRTILPPRSRFQPYPTEVRSRHVVSQP